jgi:hypothetical protein
MLWKFVHTAQCSRQHCAAILPDVHRHAQYSLTQCSVPSAQWPVSLRCRLGSSFRVPRTVPRRLSSRRLTCSMNLAREADAVKASAGESRGRWGGHGVFTHWCRLDLGHRLREVNNATQQREANIDPGSLDVSERYKRRSDPTRFWKPIPLFTRQTSTVLLVLVHTRLPPAPQSTCSLSSLLYLSSPSWLRPRPLTTERRHSSAVPRRPTRPNLIPTLSPCTTAAVSPTPTPAP